MASIAVESTPLLRGAYDMVTPASDIDTPVTKNALVPSSSSPSRAQTIPLAATKLIPSLRRGVSFSPKPDTKLFHVNDAIVPENGPPPASIRSYANEPASSPAPTSPQLLAVTPTLVTETPILVRSVLKRRKIQDIRIARTVEEGTLNNREDARLLVSGRRPGLVARDSYQLAMLRKGTDEVSLKSSKLVDMPGSDDSAASDDQEADTPMEIDRAAGSDEEEEELEQNGALATGSLVDIVLNGAEDLLTLEEAYKTLVVRLKQRIPLAQDDITDSTSAEIDICLRPIRDEAPAMVRALQRDVQRLLGKVPNSEFPSLDRASSPFRGLVPLRDATPINRLDTPSPSPAPSSDIKAPKPPRQGYSEAEVRYRREASGVGQAALGLLGLAFHCRPIYSCFTEADLQSLLELVLTIPRTPSLPTPNPKKTYFVATAVLSNMRIPAASVNPIREKIAKAIESMTSDTFGPAGAPIKDPNFRKEVYNAILNLVSTYPYIFFGYTAELLAPCLRALISPTPIIRARATSAVVAFAAAKFSVQAEARDRAATEKTSAARAEWVRVRQTVGRCEIFVANHLKRVKTAPGRVGYTQEGEKKTEWGSLDRLLKDKMMSDVFAGCAIWAALVSLLGTHYATCGLTEGPQGFNNIMNKSLQASGNITRAILARVAWNHAVHAYLSAGSTQSINDAYQLVQSFKPFASFGLQDATDRLQCIQMPVDLAMEAALAPASYSRVIAPSTRFNGEERCHWHRTEKGKRQQWTVTCGESTAAVVYAFVGTALLHEEQPAKEMSALSGLPSSDGPAIPESARSESRLERLDKAWDKVVQPLLRSLFSLHGVDKLKLHGWSILSALLSHRADLAAASWHLDRLLCSRFLSGEALMDKLKDKEVSGIFLDELEQEAVGPKDIPSMGSDWVVRRLDSVLDMFQEAINGINGINDLYGGEAVHVGQGIQFPVILSRVWSSILHSVSSIRETEPVAHVAAIRLINRHISQVFNGTPSNYLAVSLMNGHDSWAVDLDSARILITTRLFEMAHSMLGAEAVSHVILPAEGDEVDLVMSKMAFGTDAAGRYSMTGSLLALIMGTKVFSSGLSDSARDALKTSFVKMLDIGCAHGSQAKFLGDMTNRLHGVFEDQEDIQLDIWRILASKWATIVDTGRQSTGGTNHTGALLVSLLSNPFRGRQLQSIWHQQAGQEDLAIWSNLLEVVVARFRAKRVGPNLGVLESLAGHLGDFVRDAEKASSSTITLSCLAAATSHISCTELSHHVDDHYSINENYVPSDFLALVSDALDEAYPRTDTLEEVSREDAVSPAVYTLLETLRLKFDILPTEFAIQAFEAVRVGLLTWMTDENKVVMPDRAVQVDQLYVSLLTLIGAALEQGIIAASAETFDGLVDVVAPRLSRATSRSVPEAFQALFKHFIDIDGSDFSQDALVFLKSVVAAVPDLVAVKGLTVEDEVSEEESLSRFRHARYIAAESQAASSQDLVPPTPEDVQNAEPVDSQPDLLDSLVSLVPAVDVSTEYDADMSASLVNTQATAADEVRPEEVRHITESSPCSSTVEASLVELEPLDVGGSVSDVFGPATVAPVKPAPKRRGRKSQRLTPSRKKSRTPRSRSSTAELDVKPAVPETAEENVEEPGDCIVAVNPDSLVVSYDLKPAPRRDAAGKAGFISSASRWMSRLPALGTLFSPSRHGFDITGEHEDVNEQDHDPSTKESSRRRKSTPQLLRTQSQSELGASSSHKRKTLVTRDDSSSLGSRSSRSSKRLKVGITQSEPIVVVESDGEDELLLSPETARQRRAEEQKAMRESDLTQHSTGRFDDAPESSKRGSPTKATSNQTSPNRATAGPSSPALAPNASPVRTANHFRLLQMVQEAERQKELVESMNYDDLENFMEMIGTLQGAGQASMKTRMEELRKGKRRGGKK